MGNWYYGGARYISAGDYIDRSAFHAIMGSMLALGSRYLHQGFRGSVPQAALGAKAFDKFGIAKGIHELMEVKDDQ